MATKVSQSEFQSACNDYLGWCVKCKAFTTDSVEPDAHGYECDECGKRSVIGAEDALMLGAIAFSD